MACYRPVQAWRMLRTGEVVFGAERPESRSLLLPCGYCVGCRLSRTRAWAIRCMHEASMYKHNSFITLTYDDAHYTPTLNYLDFQVFIRKLRKRYGYFDVTTWTWLPRYFVAGEYGAKSGRAHFHALIFGFDFLDKVKIKDNLYRSKMLEGFWTSGFSSVGAVTHESAMYVAKYSCKKVYGQSAEGYYKRVDLSTGEFVDVEPEFGHMSLKPGIGYPWFERYWREVYVPRDGVVLRGGLKVKSPRFYDKKLVAMCDEFKDDLEVRRYIAAGKFTDDCTPERLRAREIVAEASLANKRSRL